MKGHFAEYAQFPLGAAYVPILVSEVEQEQRPRGNGDREANARASLSRPFLIHVISPFYSKQEYRLKLKTLFSKIIFQT